MYYVTVKEVISEMSSVLELISCSFTWLSVVVDLKSLRNNKLLTQIEHKNIYSTYVIVCVRYYSASLRILDSVDHVHRAWKTLDLQSNIFSLLFIKRRLYPKCEVPAASSVSY